MKVLVVTASDSHFNIHRPELEIFIGLARRGHQLVISTHGDSEYAKLFRQEGIKVIDAYPQKKVSLHLIKKLRQLIKKHQFDIIYATDSKTIPNAAFASIGMPLKLVAYRGTVSGLYRHDPMSYLTMLHPRIDGAICVSEAVRQYVMKKLWSNKSKAVTIHKGHDLAWYDQVPAELTEFDIKKTDFVIICAVNARPSKGLGVMIEATQYLSDIKNLHLLLVGKNIDAEPYTTLIQNSPMQERIHLAGFRQDAPELIAASQVLVQPSISGEGLPRAVMEALGYGVPSIVTTTGGGKEIIKDGVNGFIVPIKNSRAIAEKIRILNTDHKLYNRLSEACQDTLRNEYSSLRTIEKIETYFESLLQTDA